MFFFYGHGQLKWWIKFGFVKYSCFKEEHYIKTQKPISSIRTVRHEQNGQREIDKIKKKMEEERKNIILRRNVCMQLN